MGAQLRSCVHFAESNLNVPFLENSIYSLDDEERHISLFLSQYFARNLMQNPGVVKQRNRKNSEAVARRCLAKRCS